MQELVIAYRLDYARRIRRGCLERNVRGADHFQGFAQELDVERDQQTCAVHGRFDDRFILAGLFRGGRNLHLARLHLALCGFDIQASHIRALTGENLSLLAGF